MVKLSEQFKNETDIGRWNLVLANKDKIRLMLDNDLTYAVFDGEKDEYGDTLALDFDTYIGWSDGVFLLLDALGIKAEGV